MSALPILRRVSFSMCLLALSAASALADPPDDDDDRLLRAKSEAPGEHISRTGEVGFLRRAAAPGLLQGDISFGVSTARPGAPSAIPDGNLVARLGVGAGLSVRVSATRNGTSGDYRPGVGVAWQLLGREGGPFSLAVSGDYRPEGFAEPEGEFEMGVHGTYDKRSYEMSFNVVGGADPEFVEGDVEAAVGGGWRPIPSLIIGGQARGRFGFGKEAGSTGSSYDELIGAMVAYRLWRLQITAVGGLAVLTFNGQTDLGSAVSGELTFGF